MVAPWASCFSPCQAVSHGGGCGGRCCAVNAGRTPQCHRQAGCHSAFSPMAARSRSPGWSLSCSHLGRLHHLWMTVSGSWPQCGQSACPWPALARLSCVQVPPERIHSRLPNSPRLAEPQCFRGPRKVVSSSTPRPALRSRAPSRPRPAARSAPRRSRRRACSAPVRTMARPRRAPGPRRGRAAARPRHAPGEREVEGNHLPRLAFLFAGVDV